MNIKWIWVILLAVIGILAAIVAIEYFTVAIHALPSYIPGHHPHRRGHYHKRGAIAAVIALVTLGAAGYLTYRFTRKKSSTAPAEPEPVTPATAATPQGSSADQLLSGPPASGDAG